MSKAKTKKQKKPLKEYEVRWRQSVCLHMSDVIEAESEEAAEKEIRKVAANFDFDPSDNIGVNLLDDGDDFCIYENE